MKSTSRVLRVITAALVLAIIAAGFVARINIGTLSSFGIQDIALLCPLGALGSMLAAKLMIPRAVVSLVIFIILVIIFARAFCAWICPVSLVKRIRNIFKRKRDDTGEEEALQIDDAAKTAVKQSSCSSTCSGGCATCAAKRGSALDARHFVLVGALVSTLIFGFPVFCVVCPIGLTFATIMLLVNLFAFGDVTWSIIVVPVVLILEVVVFRKWCHKICPLSAFMSLIGKLNRTFVPTIDNEKCLETSKGATCGICARVCDEGINLRHQDLSEAAMSECTKCRNCVESCPQHAISMPVLPKRKAKETAKQEAAGA